MRRGYTQLSLLDLLAAPPAPPTLPAPPAPPRTLDELQVDCTALALQNDRAAISDLLCRVCDDGLSELAFHFLQLRPDFGLAIRKGRLVPLYRVGDTVRILESGPFQGREVQIVAVNLDHLLVTCERWAINRRYGFGNVRLLRRCSPSS